MLTILYKIDFVSMVMLWMEDGESE